MNSFKLCFVNLLMGLSSVAQSFAPVPGQMGTTAIAKDSSIISAWASSCIVTRGFKQIDHPENGLASFGVDGNAIGPAEGNSLDIVSLGDGGSALLTFNLPIKNVPGPDFAVFENGFTDHYMEFAFVEVSSDGLNFYRFPSFSETPVVPQISNGSFGNCAYVHNLAGKYRQGFGTPFDLSDLDSISNLDLNAITHVRLIDVVGSTDFNLGTFDSQGNIINDPFPTNFDSGGFDLDAVAVLNQQSLSVSEQALTNEIWPNPFTNELNVDVDEATFVEIYSAVGNLIYSRTINESMTIDTSIMPSGFYTILLGTSKTTRLGKIVKL